MSEIVAVWRNVEPTASDTIAMSSGGGAVAEGTTVAQRRADRLDAFDGLRAVAVLWVFANHLVGRYVPGGWIGVELFFALSGFLITRLLLNEFDSKGHVDLRSFYIRRLLRLAPALALYVALTLPAALLLGLANSLPGALAAISYTMNLYRPITGHVTVFEHTWSLSVEEQFYLVWPFLLLLGLWRKINLSITMGFVAAASVAGGAIVASLGSPGTAYVSPLPHVGTMIGGAALAYLVRHSSPHFNWLRTPLVPLAAAAMLVGTLPLIDVDEPWLYYGGMAAIGALLAMLVGHVFVNSSGLAATALSWAPLVWLGKRSYGFYLWHFPVTWLAHELPVGKLLSAALAVAFSLALTLLSWHLVERPALQLKDRFAVAGASIGQAKRHG